MISSIVWKLRILGNQTGCLETKHGCLEPSVWTHAINVKHLLTVEYSVSHTPKLVKEHAKEIKNNV